MYGGGSWCAFLGCEKAKSDGGTERVAVDRQVRRGKARGGKGERGGVVCCKTGLSGACC